MREVDTAWLWSQGVSATNHIVYHNIFSPALELRNRIIAANVYPPPQDTLQENVKISFGRDKVCSHIKKTKIKMCCLYSWLTSQ